MAIHDSETERSSGPDPDRETLTGSSGDESKTASTDPAFSEDRALALLARRDLPPDILEKLSKNPAALKSRKVKLGIVGHPRTPRYVALSLLRGLFSFDLMQVSLSPAIHGDIKVAADEALLNRMESISVGEKLSLARRASGRVAGALLIGPDPRVFRAALDNSRMTEALLLQALMSSAATTAFVRHVCEHDKWSLRREVQMALLRNCKTPLEYAIAFARALPAVLVRELLQGAPLSDEVKAAILREL